MKTLRIHPVAGRVVRDPDLRDLITAPRTVVDSPFWRRRIRDGDVSLDPSAAAPPAPTFQPAGATAQTHKGSTTSKRSAEGETS
ncbi:DUF2635 domain-containing protein [Paraburkholderia sp. 35.1]|uniref:DUF2635 domain-containing protein n=1 Tax=Paraburkholderia sp. 35.1 TaxID=2991058 RepID=UPI003D1BD1B0